MCRLGPHRCDRHEAKTCLFLWMREMRGLLAYVNVWRGCVEGNEEVVREGASETKLDEQVRVYQKDC